MNADNKERDAAAKFNTAHAEHMAWLRQHWWMTAPRPHANRPGTQQRRRRQMARRSAK